MTTRRSFLAGTLAAAAGVAAAATGASDAQAAPAAKATPAATPTPPPAPAGPTPPTDAALALAKKIQHDFPKANISDAMAQRIASDIEDGFTLSRDFQKPKFKNWDEPDFVFYASDDQS